LKFVLAQGDDQSIDQLRAKFNANAWSRRAEGGYRFVVPWVGGIGITRYAAGQFTTFDLLLMPSKGTTGSNRVALVYSAKSVTDTHPLSSTEPRSRATPRS
jgi:hypothetical protein